MNKNQKLVNSTTRLLLNNEVWLYGREVTSFCKMRRFVKKEEFVCDAKSVYKRGKK